MNTVQPRKQSLKKWRVAFGGPPGTSTATLTIQGANLDEALWALRRSYSSTLVKSESLAIKLLEEQS